MVLITQTKEEEKDSAHPELESELWQGTSARNKCFNGKLPSVLIYKGKRHY